MRVLPVVLLLTISVASQQRREPENTQREKNNPNAEAQQKESQELPQFVCVGCFENQQPNKTKEEKDEEASTNRLYCIWRFWSLWISRPSLLVGFSELHDVSLCPDLHRNPGHLCRRSISTQSRENRTVDSWTGAAGDEEAFAPAAAGALLRMHRVPPFAKGRKGWGTHAMCCSLLPAGAV